MRKIVISGSRSNVGKTLLAEEILQSFQNWSALKVTVKKKSPCPRNKNCGVCGGIKRGFDIITDKKIIEQKGTDTARLKKAGAEKVIWLRADLEGLKPGLKKSLSLFKKSKGVIIEGTSVLKFIKPDTIIFLKGKGSKLRSAAREALKKADIVINVK